MRIQRNRSKPPVRIVHMGAGAFFKAHQAWYTSKVDVKNEWGIATFSGRSPETINELNSQDCVYTLIERDALNEEVNQIESIVAAYDGSDEFAFCNLLADPKVTLVTLTITEAGYRFSPEGVLNENDDVIAADRGKITDDLFPTSTLFRLAYGLNKRRLSNAGAIAVVPCDNFPENGPLVRKAIKEIFSVFGSDAITWLDSHVSFVSTSVDRITPKLSDDDRNYVNSTLNLEDRTPVITEKFSDWVLEGDFPNGRPEWEMAGAKFVTDIKKFESRKLWMLNGAHSLIAYQGLIAGYETVDEAIRDSEILKSVHEWWREVEKVLTDPQLNLASYKSALLDRFRNPKIAHRLSQIAIDGSTKLSLRIIPVIRELPESKPAAFVIAQWIKWVASQELVNDTRSAEVMRAKNSPQELVTLLDSSVAASSFMNLINLELKTTSV